jgi:hypothetical protein
MAELSNSFHTHQSWGRTRSPKNILSSHRAGTDASGTALACNNATSAAFTTQNQRFLTVVLATYNTSFKVQGYMHASGVWADIKGSPTINAAGLWVVEINGVDQVRFVTGGNTTLFAACSTF